MAVLITGALGRWQLSRASEKASLEAAMERQRHQDALPASRLPSDAEQALAQQFRRIDVVGVWRASDTVYLDNRPMNERPGFYVLTPLVLDGQRDAVLVQRGWIPRHAHDRTQIAPYQTPSGLVAVRARLAPWPSQRVTLGTESPGAIRLNVDLAQLRAATGLQLRPYALVEDAWPQQLPQQPGPDGLWRDWSAPASGVHKHYGYAAQWFGLSGLVLGLALWFQWVKPRIVQRRLPA